MPSERESVRVEELRHDTRATSEESSGAVLVVVFEGDEGDAVWFEGKDDGVGGAGAEMLLAVTVEPLKLVSAADGEDGGRLDAAAGI